MYKDKGGNMKKLIKISLLFCIISMFLIAQAPLPSLDGRAIVAPKGSYPSGLYGKAPGFLPGDRVVVTSYSNSLSIEVLILSALDTSSGVAIELSEEAAKALQITRNTDTYVKIQKKNPFQKEIVKTPAENVQKEQSLDPDKNPRMAINHDEIEKYINEIKESYKTEEKEILVIDNSELINEDIIPNNENTLLVLDTEAYETKVLEDEPVLELLVDLEEVDFDDEESLDFENFEIELALEEDEVSEIEDELALEKDGVFEIEEELVLEDFEERDFYEDELVLVDLEDEFEDFVTIEEETEYEEAVEIVLLEEDEISELEEDEESLYFEDFETELAFEEDEVIEIEEELVLEDLEDEFEDFVTIEEETEYEEAVEIVLLEEAVEISEFEEDEESLDFEIFETELALEEDEVIEIEEELVLEDFEDEFEEIAILEEAEPQYPDEFEKAKSIFDEIISHISLEDEVENEDFEEETWIANIDSIDVQEDREEIETAIFSRSKKFIKAENLKKNAYYIQIATVKQESSLDTILNTYGKNYPIEIIETNGMYQVVIGPFSDDEYKVVLERFKQREFKDAFVRRIK